MRIYTAKEINLNHAQFMELSRAKKVRLGIDNDALFFGSVYLSFTWAWWAFIPGIALTVIFFNANKAGNSENLLDLADQDENFYEQVRTLGVWQYQMTEEDAHPYTWAGIVEASA
jgi:DNA-directed RNA polymerase alpha subunit